METSADNPTAASAGLKRNVLDLRHAIVMAVAVMAPAAAIFFNTIPQAGLVGAAIPLCYVVGFVVSILVANQFSEMAKELPASGSFYTFVAQGLGPRMGFMTGWLTLISYGIVSPFAFVIFGASLHDLVQRWTGMDISWIFWFVLGTGIVFALCYLGIKQSLQVDLTFIAFEIGICLLLAIVVIIQVGRKGQLTATPFNPASIPAGGSPFLGIVLAILSFLGFEAAATLGEETKNPRKSIPKAVFGSMITVGIFYIIMSYVATVGYGVNNMAKYATDAAPFDTISRQYLGNVFVSLVDIAGILSLYALGVAITNGASRIIFAIGREGLFPAWVGKTHPTRKTPVNAVLVLCIITLVVGIWLGLALTPIGAYGFLGTLDTLAVLVIYALVNLACFRFFWTKRRERFNWFRHALIPLVSTASLIAVFVGTVYPPGAPPLNYTPYIVIIWAIIGIGVLLYLLRTKPAEVSRAGSVLATGESEEITAEKGNPPGFDTAI
ncbi:MAG TPA: APC family permease [Ktedonobacteraceae bacterium]|nr:APC family permease [Ktedonobacteraceae bacterium]